MPEIRIFHCIMLPILLALFAIPSPAGNPLLVSGQGEPYRWADNTVSYYTDLGGLGNQTNTEANAMVEAAMQVWADVDTADFHYESVGRLDEDINAENIGDFINTVSACNQPESAVIYDLDGSAIEALGYDSNSILGFAGVICIDRVGVQYTNGLALLNGRFIDGQPDTPSHSSLTLEEFQSAFVHEFGHLIGLGHSQVNLNCLTDMPCPAEDAAGVPVMFPILLETTPEATLTLDDKSSISMLYPSSTMSTTTGSIQGQVMFSDGHTPAQGYNVVVRSETSPRSTAVSSVSGYLFTAFPSAPIELFPFGSRDPAFIGYYNIAGLTPGQYRVEVEPIHNSGMFPFIYDSAVGPIGEYLGFQYKMPGKCSLQFLHNPSSPEDGCSEYTIQNIDAGQDLNVNTAIILLGTPLPYDAWEDGE